MTNTPTMLTIKETAERTNLSYNFISKLCKNNKIVFIKCGAKFLINFEKFVEFLNGEKIELNELESEEGAEFDD